MATLDESYLSVAQAAEILKVSKSTLWRWIGQGDLPAYRFGHRRVLIKQRDLERLITPAYGREERTMLEEERRRLARPLSKQEQEKALAAFDAARKFAAELQEQRGGQLFPDSAKIIRDLREERGRRRT
jgi:excisionase family DNA binding protein